MTTPYAADDFASTNRNKSVVIDVLANDAVSGNPSEFTGEFTAEFNVNQAIDATTVEIVDSAGRGTTVIDPSTGAVTYTPDTGFYGTDTFKYIYKDSLNVSSNEATVYIDVSEIVYESGLEYQAIIDAALGYSDRSDAEVVNMLPNFIRIVEARINKAVDTRNMAVRVTLNMSIDKEYYPLPLDYSGMRDVEVRTDQKSLNRTTLTYASPIQMNNANLLTSGGALYTVIANTLQIYPKLENSILELVYYQKILTLSSTNITNWIAKNSPECYIFGIVAEINAFIKDGSAFQSWDARFREALAQIQNNDTVDRWSGTPLIIRAGD